MPATAIRLRRVRLATAAVHPWVACVRRAASRAAPKTTPACHFERLLAAPSAPFAQSGKLSGYENDIRLPFYVRGPGVPRGKELPHLISNIDLTPTW